MCTLEKTKNLNDANNLLINESVILFSPNLEVSLTLNEAIVLSKLDNLIETCATTIDGFSWVRLSYDSWQSHLPFWSSRTIRRVILKLEKRGFLLSTIEHNDFFTYKTKWYRIDYGKLKQLL